MSSLCYANCEYQVNNSTYYFQGSAKYKVSLKIDKVCAKNNAYKRELTGVLMKLYLKDTLVDELYFRSGKWQPQENHFKLKEGLGDSTNCFKDTKSLNIDLKNGIINSISGNYLNLSSGISLKSKCSNTTT